jgi:hypothetical protein
MGRSNLSGPQSGDPFDLVRAGQILAYASAGDHAAIADEHDLPQTKTMAQLVHLAGGAETKGALVFARFAHSRPQ